VVTVTDRPYMVVDRHVRRIYTTATLDCNERRDDRHVPIYISWLILEPGRNPRIPMATHSFVHQRPTFCRAWVHARGTTRPATQPHDHVSSSGRYGRALAKSQTTYCTYR
jgi:hypothetical protein